MQTGKYVNKKPCHFDERRWTVRAGEEKTYTSDRHPLAYTFKISPHPYTLVPSVRRNDILFLWNDC